MNDFINGIKSSVSDMVETIMSDVEYATDYIVIFSGRFQPFHKSHFSTYQNLVKKFGKDKVYIVTSNKTDANSSPFSFNEKKKIMVKMFGIPASNIVQVKNPYSPIELTSKFDPNKTATITAVGQKDGTRLTGKYFKLFKENEPMFGYNKQGYVYISPASNTDISGTYVRSTIRTGTDEDRIEILKKLYPKIDKAIFNLLINGIAEGIDDLDIIQFLQSDRLEKILDESTTSNSAGAVFSVDDGPRYHYPNHATFQRISDIRAAKIGYTVLDYIINNATSGGEMAPDYPDGPVGSVSFLPAGVAGAKTPMNQEDLVGSAGWNKWYDHVTRVASLVGYEVLHSKEERIRQSKERKQTSKQSSADDNLKFNKNTMSESTLKMIQTAINEFESSQNILEVGHDMDVDTVSTIQHCIDFTFKELNITKYPHIKLTNEREDISTTAYYNTQTHSIKVYVKNRALADVLRSVVHEIVHHQQNLEGRLIQNEDSEWAIGETDPWETEAHAMAGHVITKFKHISEKDIYINEVLNKKHEYACLMAETERPLHIEIDKEDVYDEPGFGIEDEFHVTILYGLHGEVSFDDVLNVIGNIGQFNIKYTGIGIFESEKYDVLKFNVESDVLNQLNTKLKQSLPYTSNFDDYKAHQTIAYLKRGTGKKYVREFDAPIPNIVRTIYYSHPSNEKEYYKLNEQKLNEDPDSIDGVKDPITGKKRYVDYGDNDARAFGMYKGKMYSASSSDIFHDELAFDPKYDDEWEIDLPAEREDWDFAGRLWKTQKMISFWQYPQNKSTLLSVIKKLEKEAKVKIIGNGYRIEIVNSNKEPELITIDSFSKSGKPTGAGKAHAKSPMKKKRKNVPSGVGSERYIKGQRTGETPAQARYRLGINEELVLEGGAYINDERGIVKCAECGKWMKQIQYRHLKYKHNMSMDEYRERYPHLPLIAESSKNIGDKNPMKDPKVISKHLDSVNTLEYKETQRKKATGRIPNKSTRIKMSKNNGMNDSINRKLVSDGLKKYYRNNPEARERVANTLGKSTYSEEYRNKMYESGKWIHPDAKDDYVLYQESVRDMTNNNYQLFFNKIPNAKKRSREWHLDHKYSIYNGFINGIPEEVISHYKNLEVIHHSINESKFTGNSILLEELIRDIQSSTDPLDTRLLLMCGGAYGHMAHPFEDMNLTFGDLKILITNALQGNLERTSEKTDGMNIMVSWKNGKLIFARNSSHLKNFGQNAMDISGIKSMFSGRGTVGDAFSTAADDLNTAITKLSEKQRQSIFNEGHNFMSLEVIFVNNLNTVPYDSNMLIFHGTLEYDEAGKPIGQSGEAGSKLNDMIKQVNQSVQKTYNIQGPPVVTLPQSTDFSTLQGKYLNRVGKLQKKFNLKDSDTVSMYHQSWWEVFIETEAKRKKITLTNDIKMGLVKRWAFGDKSFRLNKNFIKNQTILDWATAYDKNNHEKQFKANILPFELLFLELGADVLSNYKSVLIINQDKAMVTLKKELAAAARELRSTRDITKLSKFKEALEKLRAIGGMKAIVPTEGLVFQYPSGKGGKIYKLTGSFASVHRIISLLKY